MTTEHPDAALAGEHSLAETLRAARDEYRAEIRLARGGAQAAEDYSTRIDRLLTRIHAEASSQTETPVALLAIGGYAGATSVFTLTSTC